MLFLLCFKETTFQGDEKEKKLLLSVQAFMK